VINEGLTIEKVTATKIIRTEKITKLVKDTWEPALKKKGKPQPTGYTAVRF